MAVLQVILYIKIKRRDFRRAHNSLIVDLGDRRKQNREISGTG